MNVVNLLLTSQCRLCQRCRRYRHDVVNIAMPSISTMWTLSIVVYTVLLRCCPHRNVGDFIELGNKINNANDAITLLLTSRCLRFQHGKQQVGRCEQCHQDFIYITMSTM